MGNNTNHKLRCFLCRIFKAPIVAGIIFSLLLLVYYRSNISQSLNEQILIKLNSTAHKVRSTIFTMCGNEGKLLLSPKNILLIANDLKESEPNMEFLISPYLIDNNGMVDMTYVKVYLIYTKNGCYITEKAWPIKAGPVTTKE